MSEDYFSNTEKNEVWLKCPASLTVWSEVRPHHHALRQHRLPGPSRPTMAFSLSWKVSPPDLQKRPSSCHEVPPPHLCPWAKGFRFPRTQCLIRPQGGHHLWAPRSRPALQTPGTVSELASSSAGRSQSLREGAPDTRLTPLSFIQSCIGMDCSISCQEMLGWKVCGNRILTMVYG